VLARRTGGFSPRGSSFGSTAAISRLRARKAEGQRLASDCPWMTRMRKAEVRRQPCFPGASRYNPVVSSPTSFASTLSSRLRASGSALVGFLFPGDAERDPGFKEEICHRSLRGVYILVGVTAFMPFLALLFHGLASLFEPEPQTSSPSRLALLTLAGCALAATRTEQGRRHARPHSPWGSAYRQFSLGRTSSKTPGMQRPHCWNH